MCSPTSIGDRAGHMSPRKNLKSYDEIFDESVDDGYGGCSDGMYG